MSYIYLITNDINNKVYVGQTSFSIEKRFTEHCQDSVKSYLADNRPLYRAMQKYGTEHFHVSLIEECSVDVANEREIYWIGYYHSYTEGYNATLGGEGRCIFNHEAIVTRLKEYPYPKQIAQEFGCSTDTVREIAKSAGIVVRNAGQDGIVKSALKEKKEIMALSKDGNLIKTFPSTAEAARWCVENGYAATLNSGVRSHINEAANGKRKSAYKCLWKYVSSELS